jgi:dolichol-phosphate mannosyltransferase
MGPVFLSVVAPCFNEEGGLEMFYKRVSAACESVLRTAMPRPLPWELVLVNDGSEDQTFQIMQYLVQSDPHVVAVNLARNYGHQIALTAGLQQCRGERILVIDADLQDPPELLGPMLQTMEETGADVVYGQRRSRSGETRFKTATAALFYRLLRRLVEIEIPLDTGDFRLMSRRTLDVLNLMPEQHRFIRGLVAWTGLRQVPFEYDRDPRYAGATGYSLPKMFRFALDAVTSFSIVPLRIASFAGLAIGAIGLLGLLYTIGSWAFGSVVAGWTSVATLVLLIGGVQLMVLGVFGEYLGRLYLEAKRRPLFVVDRVLVGAATRTGRVLAPYAAGNAPPVTEGGQSAATPTEAFSPELKP